MHDHTSHTATSRTIPVGTRPDTDQFFANYELGEVIGRGGFGVVHRARHRHLNRDVAVKVLTGRDWPDRQVARFRRECRALASLDHPNVIRVHDATFDAVEGLGFIVMEFAEGGALDQRMPLTPIDAVGAVHAAARGVGALHDAGIVHGDIKPQNLLVTSDGTVKVTDLGIARLDPAVHSQPWVTQQSPAGTLSYSAPELLTGSMPSAKSDVYALGATLYALIEGNPPFGGQGPAQLINSVLNDPPPPIRAAVPNSLRSAIWWCLAKQPDMRPSIGQLITALENPSMFVSSGSSRPVPRSTWSKRRWLVSLAAIVAASVLLIAGVLALGNDLGSPAVNSTLESTSPSTTDPTTTTTTTTSTTTAPSTTTTTLPPTTSTTYDTAPSSAGYLGGESVTASLKDAATSFTATYGANANPGFFRWGVQEDGCAEVDVYGTDPQRPGEGASFHRTGQLLRGSCKLTWDPYTRTGPGTSETSGIDLSAVNWDAVGKFAENPDSAIDAFLGSDFKRYERGYPELLAASVSMSASSDSIEMVLVSDETAFPSDPAFAYPEFTVQMDLDGTLTNVR